MSTEQVKQIQKYYSAFSEKRVKAGKEFSFYPCEHWRNPVMSPIFASQDQVEPSSLKSLQQYFDQLERKSPFDNAGYFNIYTREKSKPSSAFMQMCNANGWQLQPGEQSLNCWSKQTPLSIPRGYSLKVGHYFDKLIYADFVQAMQANFQADKSFMRYLDKMIKPRASFITTVLIHDHRAKLAGAGLVATRNQSAFLFCGSINEKYRGQNLWRTLISARQAVSAAKGAKDWATSTRVPLIMWRGETNFRINIFNRISSSR